MDNDSETMFFQREELDKAARLLAEEKGAPRVLSKEERKALRKQAGELFAQGMTSGEVEKALKLDRKTVHSFYVTFRAANPGAPRARGPRKFQTAAVTERQLDRFRRTVAEKAPDRLRLPTSLWTWKTAAEYLQAAFGVSVTGKAAQRYLAPCGFAIPCVRDRFMIQRARKDFRAWKIKVFKKRVLQHIDAVRGIVVWTGVGTAHVGSTDVRYAYATGKLFGQRFLCSPKIGEPAFLLDFLDRIRRDAGRPVFVVVDEVPFGEHREAVAAWLAEHKDEIEVIFAPPVLVEHKPRSAEQPPSSP